MIGGTYFLKLHHSSPCFLHAMTTQGRSSLLTAMNIISPLGQVRRKFQHPEVAQHGSTWLHVFNLETLPIFLGLMPSFRPFGWLRGVLFIWSHKRGCEPDALCPWAYQSCQIKILRVKKPCNKGSDSCDGSKRIGCDPTILTKVKADPTSFGERHARTWFFKVTFSSSGLRSLTHEKGHLWTPKRSC